MLKLPKNEGLNIVPFIDIMLVLLAIVLSISTFIAHAQIQIELPKSTTAQSSSSDSNENLVIFINKDNEFFIEDKKTDLETLKAKIQAFDKAKMIELKNDKESKFESFIQVIDILKESDHKNFQIITEKEK